MALESSLFMCAFYPSLSIESKQIYSPPLASWIQQSDQPLKLYHIQEPEGPGAVEREDISHTF